MEMMPDNMDVKVKIETPRESSFNTIMSDGLDFKRDPYTEDNVDNSQDSFLVDFNDHGNYSNQTFTQIESKSQYQDSPGSGVKSSLRKPPFSFSKMIQDLLLKHEKLSVKEILTWLVHEFPEYFSMEDKKWKASVRSCLTQKDHFVNEKPEGKPSCWRLSDTVLRKLKSPVFESEHLMKENIPIDRGSWNSGKYKTIAPKLHSYSENSSDGIVSQPPWSSTPLKSQNINEKRLCVSEDKNLFRRNVAAFTRPSTGTTFRIGPASSTEKKNVLLSKNKRIKGEEYEPRSKARKRLLDISDSKKHIHLQITGNSCTSHPDGKFMKLHDDIAISTDNASFNFVGNSTDNKRKMETFRDHPDYPFSMKNNLPSDKSSNAGEESLSESQSGFSSN
ncbi:uncharacterized protein LOC135695585 [Rhopilema esculentum]|uniref:uncharacterized protein LOC135695585 n=1 Tax=Rhopilema esculentum TaxID=499914 RepID=UPI0031CE559E